MQVDAPSITADPIPGGVHVKVRSDGKYCIDVLRMLYNYRIVLSPVHPKPHEQVAHGWCFFGHGSTADGHPRTMESAWFAATCAAAVWDGYGDPPGFDKKTF